MAECGCVVAPSSCSQHLSVRSGLPSLWPRLLSPFPLGGSSCWGGGALVLVFPGLPPRPPAAWPQGLRSRWGRAGTDSALRGSVTHGRNTHAAVKLEGLHLDALNAPLHPASCPALALRLFLGLPFCLSVHLSVLLCSLLLRCFRGNCVPQ